MSPTVTPLSDMEQRTFDGGIVVSVLGVGCGRVGSINNTVPMREVEATLEAAVEAGINLFDTADIYGQGDSERTLGRLLSRHSIFVITKIGRVYGRYAGAIRIAKPLLRLLLQSHPKRRSTVLQARAHTVTQNFSPQYLNRAIDNSRRRLGLDQLNGLLLHNPSVETLLNPAIHDFLCDLLREGKTSQVGVSVELYEEVVAALKISAITMLQVPLGLAKMISHTSVAEVIRQRRIGLFVREILQSSNVDRSGTSWPRQALSDTIAAECVTAAIIGVSSRVHLKDLLPAVS
jgi:aryl-alcohol dehydrogenase-like predicted oxidoreductase